MRMLTARRGPNQARARWTALPIHPLLAAAYPVVFLFAANAADQVTLAPLWLPLGVAVAAAALLVVDLRLITGEWHRAALVATVLVIGFFGYGHVWNVVGEQMPNQWPVIGAWLLLVGIGLAVAWRLRERARVITPYANLVAGFLLLLNSLGLTQAVVAVGSTAPTPPVEDPALQLDAGGGPLPDVYHIVLDRYGGPISLAEAYGFDNEPFLTALEERGFEVARHAHANYVKTSLSLVSSQNMEFLDAEQLLAEQESGRDTDPIHRRLRDTMRAPAALKELGYRYVHLSSWWEPTAANVEADRVFRYRGQDEFMSALAQTTLLRALDDPHAAPRDPYDWRVLRDHTLYGLRTLRQIPGVPSPKYVFAHLLIPHPPYVFDVDGSFMDRGQVARQGDAESYRRQLQFTNDQVLELIDHILARSGPDTLIFLQADEGPFPAEYARDEWGFRWREATDAQLEEKFNILFAMRVPGGDLEAAGFHDAITPVNAWRVIFNARFGTDLPMLPDRTWAHESLYAFYEFFEITDRLSR